jgi:hypothetical protein
MCSNDQVNRSLTLLLLWGCTSPAVANEIFRWVDSDGVVNFSQWQPADVNDVARVVTATSGTGEYDPVDDPYSIHNQAARINETWKRTEERKSERRRRREEAEERAARLQPPVYMNPQYSYRYFPPVQWPILRPPIYRPVHPIEPGHQYGYRQHAQHYQVAASNNVNRDSGRRVPYSPVTGVSQRATIQRPPTLSGRNH